MERAKNMIIALSLMSVKNLRRRIEKAHAQNDYEGIKRLDLELTAMLNHAFNDPFRDTIALISELQKILKLYSRVVDSLPKKDSALMFSPE